jgi:L-alanine-DL-glutamate epimerase-like enolase superfamily enzyme
MTRRQLSVSVETLPLAEPFRISGYVFESCDAVVATIEEDGASGRGEASGVYYTGDDVPAMLAAIEGVRGAIEAGADRQALRDLLPPCGGRNALDCALWDLEAALSGQPVWQLAGSSAPRALTTTFTLGADAPERMAARARGYADATAIKVKLTGEIALDIARVAAIRAARDDVWLGVDGNQGFKIADLPRLIEALVAARVSLLEQPLARGREGDLDGFESAVRIAADESVLSLAELPRAVGRFDVVNIKLDKCGGLTEGLMMAAEARRHGLDVMVGNMVGTSLAMAPAFVLGQRCDVVDLDGPTFLRADRAPSIVYADGTVFAGAEVWGGGAPVRP